MQQFCIVMGIKYISGKKQSGCKWFLGTVGILTPRLNGTKIGVFFLPEKICVIISHFAAHMYCTGLVFR